MTHRGFNLSVALLVVLLFALPLAARDAAKNGPTTTAQVDILNTVSMAGKQLKPGTYRVSADDSTVTLALDGKVVVEAQIQWKDEAKKPRYSAIVTNGDQVKEIHFNGKMRYIALME